MFLTNNAPIYLATFVVDMRKSIDTLCVLVNTHFDKNPADGSLYVFVNRHRNKIKILYFDRNGFALWYKRLEKGKFKMPNRTDEVCQMESQQLRWLLDGLDFKKIPLKSKQNYDCFC